MFGGGDIGNTFKTHINKRTNKNKGGLTLEHYGTIESSNSSLDGKRFFTRGFFKNVFVRLYVQLLLFFVATITDIVKFVEFFLPPLHLNTRGVLNLKIEIVGLFVFGK